MRTRLITRAAAAVASSLGTATAVALSLGTATAANASSVPMAPAAKPHVTYTLSTDCSRPHTKTLFDDLIVHVAATGLKPNTEYFAGPSYDPGDEQYESDGTAYAFSDSHGTLKLTQAVSDNYSFHRWSLTHGYYTFLVGPNTSGGNAVLIDDNPTIVHSTCSPSDLLKPTGKPTAKLATQFVPDCTAAHPGASYLRMRMKLSQAHQTPGAHVAFTFSANKSRRKYDNGLASTVRHNGLLYVSQHHWLTSGALLKAGTTYYWETQVFLTGHTTKTYTGTFTLPKNAC